VRRTLRWTLPAALVLLALAAWNAARWAIYLGPTEEVVLPAGDHQLAGLLVVGRGPAPRPAVVVLHGAGRESTSGMGYRIQAHALSRAGCSVLLHDKRGVDRSGGDFDAAGYADFVDDGLAALRYLRSRSDVDRRRVGVVGHSEGGWLAPEVARRGDAAFVLVKSGSPLSWRDTVEWELRSDLAAEGWSGDELDELVAIQRRVWDFEVAIARGARRRSTSARRRLEADLAALAERLGDRMPLRSELPDDDSARRLGRRVAYDPTPFLRRLRVPALYVFGGTDVNIPTARSVETLERLRPEHPGLDWAVFDDLGHSLMSWRGLLHAGFDPRYVRRIEAFAREACS